MKLSDLKKGYAGMNAGVWVGDIPLPLFEGIRLKARRLWNPDYAALHEQLSGEATDFSEADNEHRITTECLVQTCLLGWDGVDDEFSVAAARDLVADPDFGRTFRSAMVWAATHVADQVKTQMEADAKN